MSKFKVGDRVEIIELASVQDDEEYEKYKECVGEKGTIIKIGNFGGNSNRIKFDNTNLEDSWWNDDELEFVEDDCNNVNKPKEINIDGVDYILTPKDEVIGKENRDKFNPYKRAELKDKYYYIDIEGVIVEESETNHKVDIESYNFGNYFNDKEFTEKKVKEWKLRNLLERFSYENGGDKIDWENENQRKHYFYVDIQSKEISYCYVWTNRVIEIPHFISEEVAKLAVDKYRDLINEVYKL